MATRCTSDHYIGRKYGRLTVIECVEESRGRKNSGGLWKCKCDCNNEIIINGNNLCQRTGCGHGCSKLDKKIIYKDFTGWKIGKLIVIKQTVPPFWNDYNMGKYLAKCECGREIEITGRHISSNLGQSCGCLKHKSSSTRVYGKNATIAYCYRSHKSSANRGIRKFQPLSYNDWFSIVFLPCHYCGQIDIRNKYTAPSLYKKLVHKTRIEESEIKINGVDRIDSSKGYELDNCVPCCSKCNIMKLDYTTNEFLQHIEKISNFQCVKSKS